MKYSADKNNANNNTGGEAIFFNLKLKNQLLFETIYYCSQQWVGW